MSPLALIPIALIVAYIGYAVVDCVCFLRARKCAERQGRMQEWQRLTVSITAGSGISLRKIFRD